MFKFAFRNVLRNKKRSIITGIAIAVAAMMIGFSAAWVNGMLYSFMEDYFDYQTGHLRITTEEFYKRERFIPIEEYVSGADEIIAQVEAIEGVDHIEERIRFGILLGHDENTVQAVGMGIDPGKTVLDLPDKIVEGEITDGGLYIGKGLIDKLDVQMGEELLIATQTAEEALNGIKLPVNGVFDFKISFFNNNFFFINTDDAKRLLKLNETDTTEIYVFLEDYKQVDEIGAKIKEILPDGVIVLSYKEIMGELYTVMDQGMAVYYFFEALILFLASFVIINTMNMAIFERMHEIGTLKAMGMTDRQLFVNFTLEGAIIGAIGGVIGVIVGFFVTQLLSKNGLNFESMMSSVEIPMSYIIYPQGTPKDFILALILSIFVPALTAMIPARYAKKLTPSEALRK